MQINLTPDPSLLAIMVIFILNYLVVRTFFLKPVNEVMDARETEAKTAEQMYEAALSRFAEATAHVEGQLHTAKREAAQIRDRFRAEAATHRGQVVERTQGEAKTIVADADAKLAAQVQEARVTITRDSESLARLAAERILGRAV